MMYLMGFVINIVVFLSINYMWNFGVNRFCLVWVSVVDVVWCFVGRAWISSRRIGDIDFVKL